MDPPKILEPVRSEALSSMKLPPERVEALTVQLADEIIKAVGLSVSGWSRRLFGSLFRTPSRRFAEIGARFDHLVETMGFRDAALRTLPHFIPNHRARGIDDIPKQGPLLVASNHPGTYDALLIAANLPRDDLKVVSADIPFLAGLPNARERMIFTTQDTHVRMTVLRAALRHLAGGGSLLLFPSGHIDPDPRVLPGAEKALEEWSRSLELLLRRVPQTSLLITVVSGVVARSCARSLLTRIRRRPLDQRRLAEFMQVIQQMFYGRKFNLAPALSFADPTTLTRLRSHIGSGDVLKEIVARAKRLLAEHHLVFLQTASGL